MTLGQRDAVLIRAGEPLPPGTDAVVPHENVDILKSEKTIKVLVRPIPDQNVRYGISSYYNINNIMINWHFSNFQADGKRLPCGRDSD